MREMPVIGQSRKQDAGCSNRVRGRMRPLCNVSTTYYTLARHLVSSIVNGLPFEERADVIQGAGIPLAKTKNSMNGTWKMVLLLFFFFFFFFLG